MKYSMELTAEQRDILQGKQGDTLAKVMETLVRYGEIFGATSRFLLLVHITTWLPRLVLKRWVRYMTL